MLVGAAYVMLFRSSPAPSLREAVQADDGTNEEEVEQLRERIRRSREEIAKNEQADREEEDQEDNEAKGEEENLSGEKIPGEQ